MALAACGVASAVLVLGAYAELQAQLVRSEQELRAATRTLKEVARPVTEDPAQRRALRVRVEASNRVLQALEQPWFTLFDDVERAAIDGVALLALEPDAQKKTVRITGEARDLDVLSTYVDRIGAARSLRDLRLMQQELHGPPERARLRFIISARWEDAG
jgi:hypothetical protein